MSAADGVPAPVVVTMEGRSRRVWMLFVGNRRYGMGLFDLVGRQTIEDGLLDVRLVRADVPLARVRSRPR